VGCDRSSRYFAIDSDKSEAMRNDSPMLLPAASRKAPGEVLRDFWACRGDVGNALVEFITGKIGS
jgi:hypothetical protein